MGKGDLELGEVAILDRLLEGARKPKFAQGTLDHRFPRRRRAHEHHFGPSNLPLRRPIEPARIRPPPQESVGVEQKSHGSDLSSVNERRISAGSGASKSGAIHTRFSQPPGRRTRSFVASGTNRAFGTPALAITISSPCAARSTR